MGILKPKEYWIKKYQANVSGKGEVLRDILKDLAEEILKRAASDQAEETYAERLTEAIKAKRRQAHLKTVDPTLYKEIVESVVADMYNTAVPAKAKKYVKFVDGWHPIIASIKAEVDKMPKKTLREAIAKAARTIELERANKGKWRT